MKYSQSIGILAVIAMIFICFLPWVYFPGTEITVSGLDDGGSEFGKPGILNVMLSIVSLAFFAIKKIWAKRANVIVATINFAWAIRNLLIFSICVGGLCPQKLAGLYFLIITSLLILIMAFLPDLKIKNEKE